MNRELVRSTASRTLVIAWWRRPLVGVMLPVTTFLSRSFEPVVAWILGLNATLTGGSPKRWRTWSASRVPLDLERGLPFAIALSATPIGMLGSAAGGR